MDFLLAFLFVLWCELLSLPLRALLAESDLPADGRRVLGRLGGGGLLLALSVWGLGHLWEAALVRAAGLARTHGASIAVIEPVCRDAVTRPEEAKLMTRQRDALRVAANAGEIPYLEIAKLRESHHPENARLFGELIHPNHLGHRLMASRLLDFLESHGMLWNLSLPTALELPQPPLQRPPGAARLER